MKKFSVPSTYFISGFIPLRAFAASIVYETSTGRLNEAHLNDPVLLWLVFHLSVGGATGGTRRTRRCGRLPPPQGAPYVELTRTLTLTPALTLTSTQATPGTPSTTPRGAPAPPCPPSPWSGFRPSSPG